MGSTASLLLGAAMVAVIGALGVWLTLRRPRQAMARRQRDAALAAAADYTPAVRAPAYGVAPDPCAPGLTDAERVDAMRALLLRGDQEAAQARGSAFADIGFAPTQPMAPHDGGPTTSPMAWQPTQPFEEPEEGYERTIAQPRTRRVADPDREHITL